MTSTMNRVVLTILSAFTALVVTISVPRTANGSAETPNQMDHDANYTDRNTLLPAGTAEALMASSKQDLVCSAQTPSGGRFLAVGNDAVYTQEAAFKDCTKASETCFRTGCTFVNRARKGH